MPPQKTEFTWKPRPPKPMMFPFLELRTKLQGVVFKELDIRIPEQDIGKDHLTETGHWRQSCFHQSRLIPWHMVIQDGYWWKQRNLIIDGYWCLGYHMKQGVDKTCWSRHRVLPVEFDPNPASCWHIPSSWYIVSSQELVSLAGFF